ncbi:GNAT family N-acetyltransferase [Mariniflexile sp. AS56]|uniref:GNAT family N-acetyltransferase n=1 Tax=Mariniflexile sp. AS56 TaxID=3063957 RepID=UPI0026EC5BAC|nr:GNAT family N-acetyltransferase [Mariniflexile sp. AS56]MDO7173720.1 GNAT family N-acetyltransferase [Mariniflexile sp. AS56]
MKEPIEQQVNIIPFREDIQHHFKNINYEWIGHYFEIIDRDRLVLENPKKEIIDKGGHIYFAEYNTKIVGCVALEKKNDTTFELSKMGVRPSYQGLKIGKLLMLKTIEKAKQLRFKKIILYTNPKLISAIGLYQKNGFYEVPNDLIIVKRAVVKMELKI